MSPRALEIIRTHMERFRVDLRPQTLRPPPSPADVVEETQAQSSYEQRPRHLQQITS